MKESTQRLIRGRLLCPTRQHGVVEMIEDGLLHIDVAGQITAVEPASPDCATPVTRPNAVWMPGLIDTHIHFPQTQVLGSATGPLLDWLAKTVFPEEARFVERSYAQIVAKRFCDALISQGTTSAAVFSSPHEDATDALFAEMDRRGLRGQIGLTLMDRGAPPENCLEAGAAIDACTRLIERWHGHDDRLAFCVTPRFALSCTPRLLRDAARLAEQHQLPIQTHLSENRAEIAATRAQFPGSADYLAVYADHGLTTPRSLFAHCIWLDDSMWDRLADQGCAVAHCPDSNFFLGSGCMPLDAPISRGVRVGLGSDVGAGRTFSIRRVAASAYDASLITYSTVSAERLLWLATLGGAQALGLNKVGRLAPGYDADLIAVEISPERTGAALFDALVFHRDHGPVAEVRVRNITLS